MKKLFFLLYIVLSMGQNIKAKDQCYYTEYLFLMNNSFCFDSDNLEMKDEKGDKIEDPDNIIYIGIFSLIKERNKYRIGISGCKTQKIIKSQLKFELSIKKFSHKIMCTIPKLNSTEIDYFEINCKLRKNEYFYMLEDIELNEIPTLKGYTFKGFERYIPRSSRKK